jgi:hypothetical protein
MASAQTIIISSLNPHAPIENIILSPLKISE